MSKANSNHSTISPADSSRRRFLAITAAASAVSAGALAVAAAPVRQACTAPPGYSALERIEFIVRTLRESFVREGWKLNEPDAARVIRYFRRMAEGKPELEFDPEGRFVSQWVSDHGQSFDWIMLGDPRSMICVGAAQRAA
jgi:hypothetical protein